ncbi:tetratricopeptide repeat protein [Pseudoponticoccus marisrubri]|uniref:Sel1 repeat family protein n=1 Tax=Pseudoponticoccus marisrubri TaxID=1685382 RepID=A0A0W7WI43_9RHOB|nr:tetratricopeptide repeat protein [Pseudoponticoccus marisrubri]KUF10266.1 hypothetical protein AVJ23_12725 [Pseudoponticoccus marisrubri]
MRIDPRILPALVLLAALAGLPPARAETVAAARAAQQRGDHAAAIAILEPLAAAGDSAALVALGRAHFFGDGVGKDRARAAALYRAAADQGDPEGMARLGQLYFHGFGVEKNQARAVELYRQSAVTGHILGQISLAWALENGKGAPQDLVTAMTWYEIAAAAGSKDAEIQKTHLERDLTPAQLTQARTRAAAWTPTEQQRRVIRPKGAGPVPYAGRRLSQAMLES